MAPVKSRNLAVIAALVALPTAATVIPGRLDAATTSYRSSGTARSSQPSRSSWTQQPAAKGGTATLVGVKVTTTDEDPPSATSDVDRARRRTAATCTNPGPGTSSYSLPGYRVSGPTTAHLTPAGGLSASVIQAAFNTWRAADPSAPPINVVADSMSS